MTYRQTQERLERRHGGTAPVEPKGELVEVQNAFIEWFNRTYRHEVLDAYVFESLDQMREISAQWLQAYNEEWPHDAQGSRPPRSEERTAYIKRGYGNQLPGWRRTVTSRRRWVPPKCLHQVVIHSALRKISST